jgi:hypothetical protein
MTDRECQLGFSLKKPQIFLVEFFGDFSYVFNMTLFCDFWSGICTNKILFVVLPQLNCWGPRKCVWQRVSTEYGIEEISIDNLYNLERECNEFFWEFRCHISEIRSKIFSLLLYILCYKWNGKPLKFVFHILVTQLHRFKKCDTANAKRIYKLVSYFKCATTPLSFYKMLQGKIY